jgi:hypothetical protein
MEAAEITTRCGDGIGQAPRQEVEERLFLYGIDVLGDDLIIDKAVESACPVLPYGADTPLTFRDKTSMTAKTAKDLTVLLGLLEQGLFQQISSWMNGIGKELPGSGRKRVSSNGGLTLPPLIGPHPFSFPLVLERFRLDLGLAGPADNVRRRASANETAPVRARLNSLGLEDHLQELALGYVPVHVQIRAKDRPGQCLDRVFFDEIRKIGGHDNIR